MRRFPLFLLLTVLGLASGAGLASAYTLWCTPHGIAASGIIGLCVLRGVNGATVTTQTNGTCAIILGLDVLRTWR